MQRVLTKSRQRSAFGLGPGLVEVILIASGIMREPASGDVHDVIGQRADEIDIVADESEGALELVEGVGQRVNARQIQMGGRLIHQQ